MHCRQDLHCIVIHICKTLEWRDMKAERKKQQLFFLSSRNLITTTGFLYKAAEEGWRWGEGGEGRTTHTKSVPPEVFMIHDVLKGEEGRVELDAFSYKLALSSLSSSCNIER